MTAVDQFEAVAKNVIALTQSQIVAMARTQNDQIMATDPKPLGFVRHVDGVEGAPEEAMKPGGVIVYDYNRLDLIVEFALDTLRQLSPVDKGDYVRSHTIFVKDQVVDDPAQLAAGANVVIANTVPYARKIEFGGKKFRTHPQVYERAERTISRRFGNIVSVSFGYYSVTIGDVEAWAKTTKSGRRGGSKASVDEWLRRQPALFINQI